MYMQVHAPDLVVNNVDQDLTFLNNEDKNASISNEDQVLAETSSYQNFGNDRENNHANLCIPETDSKSLYLKVLHETYSLLLSQLQTQHNVPASVVQLIFEELNKFCFFNLEWTLSFVTSNLVDLGLPVTEIESLKAETIKKKWISRCSK